MKRNILGVVLIGGFSRRMGEDKALMSYRQGMSQLEYSVALLAKFCQSVAVCGRVSQCAVAADSPGIAFIPDAKGVKGPMAGVISALRYAERKAVLAIACDMPLLEPSVLLQLVCLRNSSKLATCLVAQDGRLEPLCSIYEPRSLKELEFRSVSGLWSLRTFLQESNVERIPFKRPELLASANTLTEARIFRKLIEN